MKKRTTGILAGLGVLIFAVIICAGYVVNNMTFHERAMRKVWKSGYEEKSVQLPNGTIINYAEGGRGIPLLLIHGQGAAWTDYAEVLPALAEKFHVFVPDCHGHGTSSHDPSTYFSGDMGMDFAWFIEVVIQEKAVISGHSSGGLLTALIAADRPDLVTGIVIEDPPFFSSEEENAPMTFAWKDSFSTAHEYLNQDRCRDYPLYYLQNCMWIHYFGTARDGIIATAKNYRESHDGPVKIFYLPPSITRPFLFLDQYDPRFGDAFYDFSWFRDFDQRKILGSIQCPAVLIHNNWSIDDNGVLLGAMTETQAKTAVELMKNSTLVRLDSGHNSHAEKPGSFSSILINFTDQIEKQRRTDNEL